MDTLTGLLSSRVKAQMLRLLFAGNERELHLRDLARQAGLNSATVRQEVKRLASMGLLVQRRSGNRTYYRARTDHPIYPDLRNLVLKTSGLVEVLKRDLKHPGIQVAFVFGSVASGNEQAHSDVDLMAIGSASLREVSRLLRNATEAIGREINPHTISCEEFRRRIKADDHFLTSVFKAPKLFVLGDERELARLAE